MELKEEEIKKLKKAIKKYNDSSWMDLFEKQYKLKDVIESAKKIGVKEQLIKMEEYDKYLYHKEEFLS